MCFTNIPGKLKILISAALAGGAEAQVSARRWRCCRRQFCLHHPPALLTDFLIVIVFPHLPLQLHRCLQCCTVNLSPAKQAVEKQPTSSLAWVTE